MTPMDLNTAPASQESAAADVVAPLRGDKDGLREVEDRVLWLATGIVDHANRVRPNASGLKVGGHQASSASMVTIMTSLWLRHLQPGDRVSVKPHASPVLHALNYLLGDLDEGHLTTLREFGGLQSYPSRAKDPDTVDYSTGSVGLGATAPLWGALARCYVDAHFGGAGTGRQYALGGDAELDEGACWEAIIDPMISTLGEAVWIVDLNRQSLDRVIPGLGLFPPGRDVRGRRLAGLVCQVRPAAAPVVQAPGRGAAPREARADAEPGVPANAAPPPRPGP